MALGPSALGAWAPGSGAWAVGSPGPGCHSCVSRRLLARWLLARLLARWQAGLLNRLACWLLISMAPWLVGSWLVGSLARRPPWLVGSFLLPLGSSALGTMALGSVPRSMALDLDGPLARRILARRLLGSSAPWLVGSFLLPLWLLALGHTRARVAPGVRAFSLPREHPLARKGAGVESSCAVAPRRQAHGESEGEAASLHGCASKGRVAREMNTSGEDGAMFLAPRHLASRLTEDPGVPQKNACTPLFHQFVAVRCKATVQTAVVRGPLSRAVGLSTKGSELAPCKILLEARIT